MQKKYITKKIFVMHDGNERGFTTGGIAGENGTILIGCDDRLTPEITRGMGLPEITAIFCCDYRRSANAGILNFNGADKYINANYLDLLVQPGQWWENPKNRWHLYKLRNDDDILPCGACSVNGLAGHGQVIIGDIKITALLTPGDTDYSMSYLVEDEGVKVIFCGGLLYKGGSIPYLYRLTQDILNWGDTDYQGFLGGIPRWKKSLEIISRGDILVPYLGGIIDKPQDDINTFSENIDEYYRLYTDISALNNFAPGSLPVNPDTKLEQSPETDFPPYVKHIGNQCNIVKSKSGNAIAIDSGGENVTDRLLELISNGEVKSIDAMYITHYHDDHVDGCEYFRNHFGCPIYADKIQADILKNPIRYRLPCISPVSVDVSPLDDGYSWRWQEFELTSFAFPGQSLYHGALIVKNNDSGEVVFFAGDSFTLTGIDDYCAYNRNLMIPGGGYFKCLDILKKYMPGYIINQHMDRAFCFTPGQLEHMGRNLSERMRVLSKLSVWDNINYSLDEYIVMAYPYEQDEADDVELLISDYADNVRCEIIPPPKQVKGKNIYGVRIYAGGMYLGQKSCFTVNKTSI